MIPARRWLSFVVASVVASVAAAGCGSTPPRSSDAIGPSTSESPNTAPVMSGSVASGPSTSTESVPDPTGAVDAPVVDTSMVETPEWQREDLGPFVADSVLSTITVGNATTLIYPEGGNTFRAMTSIDGGPFESHTVTVAGVAYIRRMPAVATPSGLLAIFSDNGSVPGVLTSTDGVTWTDIAVTGLDQPADIVMLIATPDGVYAAGGLQTAFDGSFDPAIWRSADGLSWEPVVLPPEASSGEGGVTALAGGADGLVVAVNSTIMRSTDNGATWAVSAVTLPEGVALQSITAITSNGETMVAIAATVSDMGDGRLVTLRSLDDGQTWDATLLPDSGPGSIGSLGGSISAAGDGFWIATRRLSDLFGDGDGCYHDLAQCARGSDAVLLRSAGGVDWQEVDLSKLDTSGFLNIVGVVDRPTGVLVVGASEGLRGWTWPAASAPPLIAPRTGPPPVREPLAHFDSTLTVGTVYRFPLSLHCGMGYLGNFNGKFWTVDPATTSFHPETGAGDEPPADWPVAQQTLFGYITLVEPGTIEYSLPSGEVIAKFHPTDVQPALCS